MKVARHTVAGCFSAYIDKGRAEVATHTRKLLEKDAFVLRGKVSSAPSTLL